MGNVKFPNQGLRLGKIAMDGNSEQAKILPLAAQDVEGTPPDGSRGTEEDDIFSFF
jgi:hypothetical protein